MTPAQSLELRRTEINCRLSEIAGLELTDELTREVTGLNSELKDIPGKLRAAYDAEDVTAGLQGDQRGGDGAFAEMRHVVSQARIGDYFSAVANHKEIDGPVAELQGHYGLERNELPLDMFRDGPLAAVTPAPNDARRMERPVVMPVFAMGGAAFLNLWQPVADSGDQNFPVLETRPTVAGPLTDSTEVAETTGSFAAETLQPARFQASMSYRRTDRTRFPQMSEAIRSTLSSGLVEKLDAQAVAQLVTDVSRTDATAADDFDSYRKRAIYDQIDGRFADMENQIKLLIGSDTLADMSSLFRSTTNDISAVESIRRLSGGVKVSPHIASVSNSKQDMIVRRGMRRDFAQVLWRNVEVIFDEISRAAFGEIKLTAVLQAAHKTLRTDGFARVEAQHS